MDIRDIKSIKTKLISFESKLAECADSMRPSSIVKFKQEFDEIQSTLDKMYTYIGVCRDSDSEKLDKILHRLNTLSICSDVAFDNSTNLRNESKSYKQSIMKTYGDCLRSLPNNCTEYKQANNCAELIKLWFQSRFSSKSSISTGYKLERMHEWVEDIVIEYGIHIRDGTESEFIEDFVTWCKSLSESKSNYIVPQPIFQHSKELDRDAASLSSLVIWEILMNSGLHELCEFEDKRFNFRRGSLYNRFTDIDYTDKYIDKYISYTLDPSILELAGIERR